MRDVWHPVAMSADIRDRQLHAFDVGGVPVLIVRLNDRLFAFVDRCPHQQARLSTGKLRGQAIMCPLHGARFDLATAQCIGGAYPALQALPVCKTNGEIMVRLAGE